MLQAENLTKHYGSAAVLHGISLTVQNGSMTVILGASGSGKTTALYLLSGLEKPTGGRVLYDGTDISAYTEKQRTEFRRKQIGFVFQQYALLPHLNVEQNVRLGADLAGNGEYRSVLQAVGLGEKLKSYPAELSGGEQQRVSIARALAKKPKYLFLDEPTGALDEQTGRQVLSCISALQKELGFTAVMVTHNQNIAQTANRVIRMNSGRIVGIQEQEHPKSAYEIDW